MTPASPVDPGVDEARPDQVGRQTPGTLVVGSWPGRKFGWNSFVATFCDALEAVGCKVIDVDDPRDIDQRLGVLHIHWPEQVFWKGGGAIKLVLRLLLTVGALYRIRRSGVRLVWMVHNLQPHELGGVRRPLWMLMRRLLPRLVDGFMTLSPATVATVTRAYPGLAGKPCAAPWHPRYDVPHPLPDMTACRRAQGLAPTGTLFAFIGLVRPYKGVDALLAAFAAHGDREARLLVAGQCDSADYTGRLQRLADADPRITLRLGRLDGDTLMQLTGSASVVVLPFRDYLHSGSMIHALSHARPVITPSAPFADGLASVVGAEWVNVYDGELRLADFRMPSGEPDLSTLSGVALGSAAQALYRKIA